MGKKLIYKCECCDGQVSDDAKFCRGCGAQLIGDSRIYYSVEYYDVDGGHGELNSHTDFDKALKEAEAMYKREKSEKQLGVSTGYIGVGGTGTKFAIVYVDKNYPMLDGKGIDNADDRKVWVEAAKRCLSTQKTVIGEWVTVKK